MDPAILGKWALIAGFLTFGLGLFFAKVEPDKLRERIHTWPGLALYRFRSFRYLMSAVCYIMAAVVYYARFEQ
jgi:hypothetical protein